MLTTQSSQKDGQFTNNMNNVFYAFVGPRGRINKVFTEVQPSAEIPKGITQIQLTENEFNTVKTLNMSNKHAVWKNGSVAEFQQPTIKP